MNSGLDGSIVFESDRAENQGLHFVNDTTTFVSFRQLVLNEKLLIENSLLL
jgi:hypothetical protein